ncbi:MAG: winged helix-turn-helix domain-containing protein [Anaerolineae bacterium]|nr:winged helix-turn-helix domain-containing protein [Anaerolineae bacterium]MDH7472739.1 winged helix-turn-helix domain-containing protein [Anaerolineae bacterium]
MDRQAKVISPLQKWLAQQGFHNGQNPFATVEAERETELKTYFIRPPFFDQIVGDPADPRTNFVFAARGAGKTACRLMIQRECLPNDLSAEVLAVPYTDFGWLDQLSGTVSLHHHLEQILRAGLAAIWTTITKEPVRFYAMPIEQRALLRALVQDYYPSLFSPYQVLRHLRALGALPRDTQADITIIEQAIRERQLREILPPGNVPTDTQMAVWLTLADTAPLSPSSTDPTHLLLNELTELAQAIGARAVYVLLDGIDEHHLTAENPDFLTEVLSPLTRELRVLHRHTNDAPGSQAGLAFKFFLPQVLYSPFREQHLFRTDLISSWCIEWSDEGLTNLLQARLMAFSAGKIQSMDQLADTESRGKFDQWLVERAYGSPRNMLKLGHLLLEHHCQQNPDPGSKLNYRLLPEIENEFEKRFGRLIPPLRVDEAHRRIYVGESTVEGLTEREFDFLHFLYRTPGVFRSRQEIYEAIYPQEKYVGDEAIDSLVSRLRKKIERDPKRPMFLHTKRGGGYALFHTANASTD